MTYDIVFILLCVLAFATSLLVFTVWAILVRKLIGWVDTVFRSGGEPEAG